MASSHDTVDEHGRLLLLAVTIGESVAHTNIAFMLMDKLRLNEKSICSSIIYEVFSASIFPLRNCIMKLPFCQRWPAAEPNSARPNPDTELSRAYVSRTRCFPRFRFHFLRIRWSFIDLFASSLSVLRAVFFIGIFLEDIVWGWLLTPLLRYYKDIPSKYINSNLKRCSPNLKILMLYLLLPPTPPEECIIHSKLHAQWAPWQVSFQENSTESKGLKQRSMPTFRERWNNELERDSYSKPRVVSHAVDEKCFDMNNELKIFIDGVVIKFENTFVESSGKLYKGAKRIIKGGKETIAHYV